MSLYIKIQTEILGEYFFWLVFFCLCLVQSALSCSCFYMEKLLSADAQHEYSELLCSYTYSSFDIQNIQCLILEFRHLWGQT